MMEPEAVLITGARAPVALELARAFHAAGYSVHMADCVPSVMARLSRAPCRVHRYASPRSDPSRFRDDLARIIAAVRPVLVVPTCEEVFHLAAWAMSAALGRALYAPAFGVLKRLHAKSLFAKDCLDLGLRAPQTWLLTRPEQVAEFADRACAFVFKPEYSRFGTRALVRPSRQSLEHLTPSAAEPWVAQRHVEGDEVSFYATCAEGELTSFRCYRSTWRFNGGAGYAFRPLAPHPIPDLRHAAEILARRVGRGQFACDVIIDAAGIPWLIECNPRATSGVHFYGRASTLAETIDGSRLAPDAGDDEVSVPRHVVLALWLYGLPRALRERRLSEWRVQRASGIDVVTAPADRLPLAGAVLDSIYFAVRALRNRRSLESQMTADIEWNGEPL